MRIEGAWAVLDREIRSIDRLLQVEAERGVRKEEVETPLILRVAAGRAERHVGLAVSKGKGRAQRGAGSLARQQRVRVPRPEIEHLSSGSEGKSETGHDGI